MAIMLTAATNGTFCLILLMLTLLNPSTRLVLLLDPRLLFLDTTASAHMTVYPSILDPSKNYKGKDSMIVGNGAYLPIAHTRTLFSYSKYSLIRWLGCPASH